MINAFFENLPPQVFLCDETADCKAYYLRGDSCAPPVILGILGDQLVADNSSKLVPLQSAVRRFCPEPEIACAPVVVPFACVDNRCVEIDPSAPSQQATPAGQQQGDNTGAVVPEQPTGEPANPEAPAQTPQQTMPQEPPQEVIVLPPQ